MPEGLPPTQKPPLPNWFWVVLALLVVAMAASLTASVLLPSPLPPAAHPKAEATEITPIKPLAPVSPTVTEFPAIPENLPEASPTTPQVVTPTAFAPAQPAPEASEHHWVTNSKAAAYAGVKGPKLAIIIDDMGAAPDESKQALSLPKGVTFSFLSYGAATPALSQEAFDNGHEIMMHLPMEPLPHPLKLNPGPDTLEVGDAPDVITAKIAHHLQQLGSIAVGVNNHMGSRFTTWPEGMRTVLQQLNTDGYFFLDSLTINRTATQAASTGLTLPLLRRDVFLDHDPTPAAINHELDRAVTLAQKQGFAIAIGHPLSSTLAVLFDRLPGVSVTLVPVTAGLPAGHH